MSYSCQSHFFDMPHRLFRGSELSLFHPVLLFHYIGQQYEQEMGGGGGGNESFNKRTRKMFL